MRLLRTAELSADHASAWEESETEGDAARLYRFQVLLAATRTGLDRDSKAQAKQIRSVSVERIGERVGLVPYSLSSKLDEAIRIQPRPRMTILRA